MCIELDHVTRIYRASKDVLALDEVSLMVPEGEWLAVMGPSGSGKSTLVNLIGCLDKPTRGEVSITGVDVSKMSAGELNRFRAETIGFIFQQFHAVPYLSALENVMLAQYFHSTTDKQQALDALEKVGLKRCSGQLPSQLSGGEQQRMCIARALINDPKIILADEPTGNLDERNEQIVLDQLRELHAQGRTIIMVTHDPEVARLADRRLDIHHGKIACQQSFVPSCEAHLDEFLEQLWIMAEDISPVQPEFLRMSAAQIAQLRVKCMQDLGLVNVLDPETGNAVQASIANHAHKALGLAHAGREFAVLFTEKGRTRAEINIRRHRLAEHLLLHDASDRRGPSSQTCSFQHPLSPEVTDSICSLLGHPRSCPHHRPIPMGQCCIEERATAPIPPIISTKATGDSSRSFSARS
jgi:putative ABC transport system ATP-binding protein